jgi:hypothetical protein
VPLDTIPDFVPTQLVSFVEGVKDNVVNTVTAVAGSIVDALHVSTVLYTVVQCSAVAGTFAHAVNCVFTV